MNPGLTIISSERGPRVRADWEPISESPVVGKDILELLSSSMYVNALSIYREYIQNSADAIDEASRAGILAPDAPGRIDIKIDQEARVVRIRDNGIGLGHHEFISRLVAFGASAKRGTSARGFRGVGRLAGLGYCKELIFRSRVIGQADVRELRWDCRELKDLLRRGDSARTLEELVRKIVTSRRLKEDGFPRHFFEVELVGIVRHGSDVLLNNKIIEDYVAQVAPVPFAPEFKYGREIELLLGLQGNASRIEIRVGNGPQPIYRPHRNEFEVRRGVLDSFRELQPLVYPESDEGPSAVGWILHHGYLGALPAKLNMSGIRIRVGNMQIGESSLLDHIFPEPRFNLWVVGEIHIVDGRVLPNGRRDHFEQNIHFNNVQNYLTTIARELARRCRSSSITRNWVRQFDMGVSSAKQNMAVLRQGAVTRSRRMLVKEETAQCFMKLDKIASSSVLDVETQKTFRRRINELNIRLTQFSEGKEHRKLRRLREPKRRLVQRMCDLIYDALGHTASARSLVDKILRHL